MVFAVGGMSYEVHVDRHRCRSFCAYYDMQEHATPVFSNVVNALDGVIQSSVGQDPNLEIRMSHLTTTRLTLYAVYLMFLCLDLYVIYVRLIVSARSLIVCCYKWPNVYDHVFFELVFITLHTVFNSIEALDKTEPLPPANDYSVAIASACFLDIGMFSQATRCFLRPVFVCRHLVRVRRLYSNQSMHICIRVLAKNTHRISQVVVFSMQCGACRPR